MARHTGGWLKLYRSLLGHPAANDIESIGLLAWLLMSANHNPSRAKFGKTVIDIKPGQVITGRKEMAERLLCSESMIERRLEWLEICGTIEQKSDRNGRVITILNWDDYQAVQDDPEQKSDNDRTEVEQNADNTRTLSGEGKKERREELRLESESHDSAPSSPRKLAALWNEKKAPNQPKINPSTLKAPSRRFVWAQSRLAENPDLTYWAGIIDRIAKSAFCRGLNDRGWRADFEFLVRIDTHVKVLEGKYDDQEVSTGNSDAYWSEVERLVKEQEAKDAASKVAQ